MFLTMTKGLRLDRNISELLRCSSNNSSLPAPAPPASLPTRTESVKMTPPVTLSVMATPDKAVTRDRKKPRTAELDVVEETPQPVSRKQPECQLHSDIDDPAMPLAQGKRSLFVYPVHAFFSFRSFCILATCSSYFLHRAVR